MKYDLPMGTSTAIALLANSNLKHNAVISHICNGAPMVEAALISPPSIDPDPNIANDLASQLILVEDQIQTLYDWALAN